jgi:glucose-6-phosphate isomerase
MIRCDATEAWAALRSHFEGSARTFDLRQAFAADPTRFARHSLQAPEVFVDFSKSLLDGTTLRLLLELAGQCELPQRRDAMLRGELVNTTEGRAVLHTALRTPPDANPLSEAVGPAPFQPAVHEVLEAMLGYADQVRADGAITDVVNIGIGGSDLGPQMVVQALDAYGSPGRRLHFVSNVDGHDIAPLLRHLDAKKTLFIVASKTFTTQETMANAHVARDWFLSEGGTHIERHFAATTSNVAAAAAFGIEHTFGFWDWVGGRYSLWSAIGLPIAIAIGPAAFRELLDGAHAMDRHFAQAPLAENLPVLLGLIDVWYRNFHGFTSRSVAPYHHGLRRLPAYLQQLEMESNGKGVDGHGHALGYGTSPVVWGEPGTNGQHAYFQMLHQGTDVIPVEFIAVKTPAHKLAGQHRMLLANCLAQSQALMLGKTAALAQGEPTVPPAGMTPAVLAQHRSFTGNRPSTTLVLEALTPASLGALIALYEHRVYTSGAIWGINSFDQWGVELGKALCGQLLPHLDPQHSGSLAGLDASTAGLLQHLRA